ncbi:MAG: trehalose-6-phosphate synthase [Acidobacteriota bacterium]|nr:trehalose-6-phosphate synthase [Acidobacteriota bacterium]
MTASELVSALGTRLSRTKLIVVANREPYIHVKQVRPPRSGIAGLFGGRGERISRSWMRPASGLVTALDPVMRACGGTWIAHGSGSGDREASDDMGRVAVPPDAPSYTLRRVWLTQEEEEGYYYGLSNNALWPLCHIAYARPEFDDRDWQQYRRVNQRFANTVVDEIGDQRAIVFVQDYHFALLPRMVKETRPDAIVCQFWHIPWPNSEAFRICPWGEEIVDGLLGNDLLGFHIQHHCNNFIDTVDASLEARIDREHFAVVRRGHRTYVKPFPISIDPEPWGVLPKRRTFAVDVRKTRDRLGLVDQRLIFGLDRLDYTKGIPERIRAFERMLERYPRWRGRVTMLQIGAPSREHLERYQSISDDVDVAVRRINERFGTEAWLPVTYLRQHHEPEDVAALYRAADVCVVSSLHDGMNLVAKEYIASRTDLRGVLVLSRFTGAARDLLEAVDVNPFAVDEFAGVLHQALSMPEAEQARRMRALRTRVGEHTIYDWAAHVIQAAWRMSEAAA